METKKYEKYDLEKKRPLFFGIGLIFSFTLVISAFEWRSEIDPICLFCDEEIEHDVVLVDLAPVTTHEKFEAPKPKSRQKPIVVVEAKAIEETTKELIKKIAEDPAPYDEVTVETPVFEEEKVDKTPRNYAEVMPTFEGGMEKFYQFLAKNIRYPKRAQRMGMQGKVYIKFIVEKDGSLSNISVARGVGTGLDEEALRVMNLVPRFIPGKQGDVRVRVWMTVPINFQMH